MAVANHHAPPREVPARQDRRRPRDDFADLKLRRTMYLLGHTDPRFTMRVYEQVFDAGPQTVAQLETVLGCRSRRPSRSIQRGRFPD